MKNAVNDILNSLFSSDKTALSQSKGSVSSKGSQSNGSTFEDVLSQLASQEAGSSASQGAGSGPAVQAQSSSPSDTSTSGNGIVSGSVTSLSETDIRITEHVKVDNLNQLAQAEQALVSLAAGLSKLLGALAGVQGMDPAQAQNALVALSGGKITAQDAQSLLASLQALVSQTPDSKNPLLLSNDQQSAFLNQMLQQMLQNQQVLFGALTPGADGSASSAVNGTAGSGAIPTTDVFLKMSFSDTQIVQFQQTNTQSSSVFIDLQTFKMSATFIQAGQTANGGSTLQPLAASDSLTGALNQIFSNQPSFNSSSVSSSTVNSQGALINAAQPLDDLSKNLKNLVQLLVGAGASQAVLTTFMNQQKNLSNADLNQALSQNLSLDNLVKSLAPASAIPPAPPTGAASAEINNTVHTQSSFSSELFVEEMFAQVSVAGQAQGGSAVSTNGSNPQPSGLEVSSLNAINDVVARLNVLSLQAGGAFTGNRANNEGKSSPSLEQLISALNAAPSAPTLPADAFSDHPQNNPLTTTPPVLLNPPAAVPVSASNIGNDLVNQAALVNEAVAAVSQALQTQASQNQSAPPQNNAATVALVTPAQPVQTSISVGQESINPSDSLLGNAPVSHLLVGPSNAVFENNFIPNVSNVLSPLTVQTPVGLSPAVQTVTVPNEAVTAQAPPVSPVSPTVQEVVAPTPVDVQVKVANPTDVSTLPNALVPAATTPGTTVSASTAQNVSASVVTGEVVKLAGQTPNPVRNIDNANQITVNNVSAVSAVQPINPQAVTAVTDGSSLTTGLNINFDQSKNTNNNSSDLSLNSNLLPVVAAAMGDKVNGGALANNVSNLKVDSLQILNQVSDQITAHASEAKAVSRLSFQLIPESLGRVTVQIALVDQAVSAKIIVSNPEVREALQHHMVDLKAALNQAGLQIDQLQVQIQGGSSNLLAQYYQYQQEGFGNGSSQSSANTAGDDSKTIENTGDLGMMSVRMSLLDVLA